MCLGKLAPRPRLPGPFPQRTDSTTSLLCLCLGRRRGHMKWRLLRNRAHPHLSLNIPSCVLLPCKCSSFGERIWRPPRQGTVVKGVWFAKPADFHCPTLSFQAVFEIILYLKALCLHGEEKGSLVALFQSSSPITLELALLAALTRRSGICRRRTT